MEFSFQKLITKQIEAITELGSSAFQAGYDAGFQAGCRFKEAEIKVEADKKMAEEKMEQPAQKLNIYEEMYENSRKGKGRVLG